MSCGDRCGVWVGSVHSQHAHSVLAGLVLPSTNSPLLSVSRRPHSPVFATFPNPQTLKPSNPQPPNPPPTNPPPPPHPKVYIIRTSGARLLALINDVMDAVALRQNRLVLQRGRVGLRALAGDVVDLTRPMVGVGVGFALDVGWWSGGVGVVGVVGGLRVGICVVGRRLSDRSFLFYRHHQLHQPPTAPPDHLHHHPPPTASTTHHPHPPGGA